MYHAISDVLRHTFTTFVRLRFSFSAYSGNNVWIESHSMYVTERTQGYAKVILRCKNTKPVHNVQVSRLAACCSTCLASA